MTNKNEIMRDVWFTSDFHFGHFNIIRYCKRPFANIQEMDDAIADRVNACVFARDSVPAGTFQTLQDDIHTGVVDVCDSDHADGFERVKRVTQAARELQLTANALLACTKPKDRDGICHQLANEDRLIWTKA